MNPKDSPPERMLHLDPSAVIPFMHDDVHAHDAKLDDLRSAVADSGAEHVQMDPSWHKDSTGGGWFSEKFDDEEFEDEAEHDDETSSLVHEMGSAAVKSDHTELAAEREAIRNWIAINIRYDFDPNAGRYAWKLREGDQAFLEAHRQQIMEAIPQQLRLHASNEDMIKIIKMVAPGATYSNEFALSIIKEDPYFLTTCRELFPDFVFDMDYVRAMIHAGRSYALMSEWRCIEQDCLQEAVDLVTEEDQGAAYSVMGEFADKVHMPRDLLLCAADNDPRMLLEMIQIGKLPEAKKDRVIIHRLCNAIGTAELIDVGILDEIPFSELNDLLQHRLYRAKMFYRLLQTGRIKTFDEITGAIDAFGAKSVIGEVSELSEEIQSYTFQNMATESGTDWIEYLSQFKRLSDDDYIFILDSMQLIDDTILYIDDIKYLFQHANDHLKAKYWSLYAVIRDRRLHEKQQQKEMNERRKHQAEAERTYFTAGNVSVETHDYHEPLDADAIVESLEYNGCVREAGDIQQQANDISRDNLMICIAGSIDELTTSSLGSGAGGVRQTVTEHRALQQFMDFIRKLPETHNGDRKSLETELTYIGEKEYSEAVEGIALYWKWFLEKDPESQLYIGAVISDPGGTTKSDIYMLDRILAYFSDDELTKYKGRILTGGDQVTQTDPEKVKAVLIDDWTISGSQLRGAYGTFIRDYPHLAKSIEIQLIASDRERVALGIEDVSGRALKEAGQEKHVPTKVRSYYVAHRARSATNDAHQARITGSHSSVDYGFTSDIASAKEWDTAMPLIASVVRPYRQKNYRKINIERLQQVNEGLSNVA